MTTVNLQLNSSTHQQAMPLLTQMGMSLDEVVNLTLSKIVLEKCLPFERNLLSDNEPSINPVEKQMIDERLDDMEKNGFDGEDYRVVIADIREQLKAKKVKAKKTAH